MEAFANMTKKSNIFFLNFKIVMELEGDFFQCTFVTRMEWLTMCDLLVNKKVQDSQVLY